VKRVLLVLAVALVMAAVMLVMAMPVFAQAADPCTTGETPASLPAVGAAPTSPTPDIPPGAITRQPAPDTSRGTSPFTGPTDRCQPS
jgi:hypothetical protein